ncbi:MAG: phosphate ABC transporter substrate-binding protein [Coleofasciculaceae cyanobacterium RL_1_1]|nr:phosphate ABC transporter substrate-binding protein [Coleofasciculaceae cyanobacterium RL_1_1]
MSPHKSDPPPIVYILFCLMLAAGGYWWFAKREVSAPIATPTEGSESGSETSSRAVPNISLPASVPSGTNVRLEGSTSMVALNANLKAGFEAQFPGTSVTTSAQGSSQGVEALLAAQADVAASSRPLTPEEEELGLVAVPVALDQIAIVVGIENIGSQTLTPDQVVDIFQGKITNWSEIGGSNLPIRVINRPPESGTHQAFKDIVLGGGDFGTGSTITTLDRDATTPMLRELGKNGIGYATASQVMNQTTVRVVAIDGVTPAAASYPFSRQLYYVYREPLSPVAAAVLGYALSPQGQQQMFASP